MIGLLAACDCGKSHTPADAGAVIDAGADATASDGGSDGGSDAGGDAGLDAALDAGFDAAAPACMPGDLSSCGALRYCAGPGFAPCGGEDVFFASCMLRPMDCVGEPMEPVCGCDLVTYDNACLAHAAGVDALPGPCP